MQDLTRFQKSQVEEGICPRCKQITLKREWERLSSDPELSEIVEIKCTNCGWLDND